MSPTALVTGVAGQDGVFLARHLLSEGYRVVGTTQPGVPTVLRPYLEGVELEEHDLCDPTGFERLLETYEPAEIYNLAGFTSVGASWDQRALVHEVNAIAVDRMLESILRSDVLPRFFQASSSEVFGTASNGPLDEAAPHDPQNPYAESKSRAQISTVRRREQDGLFTCVGILFNHESPLRPQHFVTRKITKAAAEIAAGVADSVTLGNLGASRDWGAAREYVVAMHAMMTRETPGDYVIATGQLHSLSDLVEAAFAAAGVSDPWSRVERDPELLRVADSPGLAGRADKARVDLGWCARTSFEEMVREMVQIDVRRLESGLEESVDYIDGP